MDADQLMRLLIPDGKVNEVSEATGLSTSLLYQEHHPARHGLQPNGDAQHYCSPRHHRRTRALAFTRCSALAR